MGQMININTTELVKHARRLDLMSKRSLPNAVRNTLNNLAFDVKKRTLPEEAAKAFTNRNRTFYKRFSKVDMAKGNKVKNMKATVGMNTTGAPASAREAIRNQAEQQLGGTIGGRTLIPLDEARTGGRREKNVRVANRIKNLTVHMDTADAKGSGQRQRFVTTIVTAIERFGGEANIIHRGTSGKEIIYKVKRGGKDLKTREFGVKITPLYSVKNGRTVKIKRPIPFTLLASRRSMKQANRHFRRNARHEINRIKRR